jgi:tetratricopeptide (TPR) repeat protein
VTSPYQRSSLALAEARAVVDRIDPAADPEDIAASIIEGWQATESVLRAMVGGSTLSGQPLVSALRQRNLLSLDQTHALVEFLAASDRSSDTGYRPTDADIAAAHVGLASLESGFPDAKPDVPQLADTAAFQAVPRPGSATPPTVDAVGTPVRPPGEHPDRTPRIFAVLLALVLVAAIAAAIWLWLGGGAAGVEGSLRDGIAAYNTGRLELARQEFAAAAERHPRSALPHLWLARVARDQRPPDNRTAALELSRAERLEPESGVVHREIGGFHLARGRYDEARARYTRAVQLDNDDRVAMGWLGCSLVRLGRVPEGQRFLQRAGPGDWTRCAAQATPPAAVPQGAAPQGAAPGAMPPRP